MPFGTALNAESGGYSNQTFTSYDRSASTGLDYSVNRTYSSGQGQFTQVDPIGMGSVSLISPQSLNLYTYAQNNPVNFVDPTGLLMAIPMYECVYYPDLERKLCTISGYWIIDDTPHGTFPGDDPPVGGGDNPTSNPAPTNDCASLAALIKKVRDELVQRATDLIMDIHNLPPSGPMSIAGHTQQFENKQTQLRNALNDYNTSGCGGPGPTNPIPADAWRWATKGAPQKQAVTNNTATQMVSIGFGIAVSAGTAYVIYRIIRLLPSLAPPLWETLPANLAIP